MTAYLEGQVVESKVAFASIFKCTSGQQFDMCLLCTKTYSLYYKTILNKKQLSLIPTGAKGGLNHVPLVFLTLTFLFMQNHKRITCK